jgi:3-oxoadipate enol-lactonase/4-carboxymuconolactone decarboxylase
MTAVQLHHVVEGPAHAPVVVLGGSLGSTLAMWEPQLPALIERFRVVRYDHRGHGASPVPAGPYELADLGADVLALLDRLGIERAHHVGLSLGGMVALWLAEHAPERVDRLALLCTSAQLGPPQRWIDRAAAVLAAGDVGAVADAVVAGWFTPGFAAREPARVAAARAMIASSPPDGYAACCGAIERMDLTGELATVTAPTLVITGAEDPAAPLPHAERLAAGIPSARLAVVPDAAHVANLEQPAAVTKLLLDHLLTPHEAGMAVRRAVLGDAHVDRAVTATTPFTEPFQDFITRYAWGDVWSRPGLDRRTRSCLTLALLAGLGHENELALHVRAAVRNGLTADEIGEVLLHTAIYAGVPAANTAFAVAQRVLTEIADESPANLHGDS